MSRKISTGRGHAQKAALHNKESVSINFSTDIGDILRNLSKDIKEQALRPAAYAAANTFYLEMRATVPVYTGPVYRNNGKKDVGVNATPGQLHDSIYQWHDDKKSNENRQVYAVGPNKRLAPHWFYIEYGTVNMPNKAFVRPAWTNKQEEAMATAKRVLSEKIKELMA